MRVRFSARSDVGLRREVNQDRYGSDETAGTTLLVVCDGMGGHVAGEVASRIGVETIIATMSADMAPDEALRRAFAAANSQIYAEGNGSMGTTGVAALFLDSTLHVANVGDSRAYLVREGQIAQISHDHSFVSDQVAAGLLTAEQARTSNVRNIITRALGYQPAVDVDIFSLPLRPGDSVLLSSDGMHGLIEDHEIAEMASMLPPEQAVQRLVDTANDRGGTDNITVVIAQVDEIDALVAGDTAHSAITEELPAIDIDNPLPLANTPVATVAQDRPAPRAPEPSPERPLSRLGLLLASLALVVLLGIGGFLFTTARNGPAPTVTAAPSVAASPLPASATPAVTTATAITATPATTASPTARTP